MTILHIPIIDPLSSTHLIMAGDRVRCYLHRDCPRLEVTYSRLPPSADGVAVLKPDLMAWARQQRDDATSALHAELAARDLLNLSELREGPFQTVKALAWADLQAKVEALCK